MAIVLKLNEVMSEKKMSLNELSSKVGVSIVNLSKIKTGKVKAVRFSTLNAICRELGCQPGDIMEFDEPAVSDLAEEDAVPDYCLTEIRNGECPKWCAHHQADN